MGRPTVLTKTVHDRLLAAIRVGATYELACKYAGIGYSTFAMWRAKAAAEVERVSKAKKNTEIDPDILPYVELSDDIELAEGEAAMKWLAQIDRHARTNAQWAAWKLERRYPADYGRVVIQHEVNVKDLSDDELLAIVEGASSG